MTPEETAKLQALLDSKNHTGVNLELNPNTGHITWGCRSCGAAPVLLADKCAGGAFFPGFRCKEKRNDL